MGGLTRPRRLEAADAEREFDCGRDSLNHWLRRHAWRNQVGNVTRTSLVEDLAASRIAGFVALSAGQIEREHLPKAGQRNRPESLPVLLLGQLAVDRGYQRRGCARCLVGFALGVALRFSREIGCFGVLTHPLDDSLRDFYGGFGFERLPFDPRGSMVVRTADLERSGFLAD